MAAPGSCWRSRRWPSSPCSPAQSGDADTWFHLRTGAYIVQNHKLPDPDPFSWTTYMGQPAYPGEETTRDLNIKHEWWRQVILYLVYAAGGFPGDGAVPRRVPDRVLRHRRLGGRGGAPGASISSLAATMAAGMIARSAATDRPFLITYLLMAITLWILERRRGLWAAAAALRLLGQRARRIFHGLGPARRILRRSAVPAPAQAAARGREDAVGGQPGGHPGERAQSRRIFNVVPGMFAYRQSLLQKIAEGMAFARPVAAQLVQRAARCRGRRAALGAPPHAPVGLAAVRGLRRLLPDGAAQRDPDRPDRAHRDRVAICRSGSVRCRAGGFAVPLVLLAIAGERIASGNAFQFELAAWQYPAGPVKFLKDHNVRAPMFNIYEWGGYLMWDAWPLQKTFVDGRALNESVFQDYMKIAL